jgi:AAHS family benzoate transporter-like MFS transporter
MANAKSIHVNRALDDAKLTSYHIGIMIVFWVFMMIDGYDLFVYGSTVPLLLKYFHMGPAYAGLIGSYSLAGAGCGALFLGSLADKIGRKYMIICCATLFCIFMFVSGFMSSPMSFGICRVITGIGIGGTMPNAIALTSEYTPLRNRAWGVAAVMSGMPMGSTLAPALSMWLLPLYGWRSVYYVGIIPILMVPVALKWMPESPLHLVKNNHLDKMRFLLCKACAIQSLPADSTFEVNRGSGKAPVIDLFREHRGVSTVLIWLVYFTSFFQNFGIAIWLPNLMMIKGFTLSKGLWFLMIHQVGAFCFSHIGGVTADHIGPRRMIIIAFLCSFFTVGFLSYSTSFVMLTVLSALSGAANCIAQNVSHGYVSTYYPQPMRSTGMGFAFGVGRAGAVLGPVISGIMLGLKLNITSVFWVLGGAGVVSAVLMWLVQDKYSFSYLSRQAAKQAKLAEVELTQA